MTALEALTVARNAGVAVALDGDALLVSAVSKPPEAVLEVLARHKGEIIELMLEGSCEEKLPSEPETSNSIWCAECGRFPDQLHPRTTFRRNASFFCQQCLRGS